jgi:hypothetical protein
MNAVAHDVTFSRFPDAPAAEAETLVLWLFDLVFALRLRWPPPPLIETQILNPILRSKPAAKVVDLLLGEDCVLPAESAR